jgi:hypothetical protein
MNLLVLSGDTKEGTYSLQFQRESCSGSLDFQLMRWFSISVYLSKESGTVYKISRDVTDIT